MNTSSTLLSKSIGLRQMFYLVLPNEANFEYYKQVPEYINAALPYFTGMILVEYIMCIFLNVRRLRISDGISSASAGLMQQIPKLVIKSLAFPIYLWVNENYKLYSFEWDSPFTWYMSFLLLDFGYYVFHRLAHEVHVVWGAHQVHHSSEDYNLTTALRQSMFQHCFSECLYIPLGMIIPPSHYMIHVQLNTLYQFWIHTECIDTLGPLEYILNTPSHHRVHHGRNIYCIDKNYAGVLIIFDKMFGTFEAERKAEPVVYGLVTPLASWNPFWTQICVYVHMFKRMYNIKGVKNKLSVLLMGPGWTEGSPRLGDPSKLPDIRAPQPRYDRNISNAVSVYGLIHFVLIIAMFDFFIRKQQYLSALSLSVGILLILFSLLCFGFIFDDKEDAISFEITRLVTVFIGTFIGERFDALDPNTALIIRFVIIVSIGFWVSNHFNKKKKVE
ncbi:hypothetical protein LOD99_1341 [Oopsacas minuta]|uniref:Alkylglycerol monooxygenase n=1 Tax=Oopsacas minuta TaxID=111878 RepID=A0AAV7K8H8_9METZ|nr:hypothetical protein LOD99_1341 [Oopsacas minuta]